MAIQGVAAAELLPSAAAELPPRSDPYNPRFPAARIGANSQAVWRSSCAMGDEPPPPSSRGTCSWPVGAWHRRSSPRQAYEALSHDVCRQLVPERTKDAPTQTSSRTKRSAPTSFPRTSTNIDCQMVARLEITGGQASPRPPESSFWPNGPKVGSR
jgi:hypothetical protein